ncbi:unnamed protein product [Phaedon cochleariae]|uniref:GRIP domain-containing protein n=1 Tax=Phaedon cochleariae TaxID=80249 RepID=A0A9P0D9Q9_PHACE|nr:unnamed protein product [Phaedon cochleariae]
MFKKLKEKITEEVKISPQRFAEFTQSVSDRLQNSTNSDDNFFSIGEDDSANNSATVASSNDHGFSSVTLVSPTQESKTRRNSTSSIASDVSFLPRYDPGSTYHLQSDLDISASEVEDNASTASSQLGHLSKEQIYSAFQKSQMRYHKYRGRYTDLSRHYKDLERENSKMKAVLVETQDKAIRRVTELKEQCNLEQRAKAHLEAAMRDDIDEKEYKIKTLQTKVELLQNEGKSSSLTVVESQENSTDNLENLTSYLNDARKEIESLNAKIQEMKASSIVFQSKEQEYKTRITNLEKEITQFSDREKENNLKLAQSKMDLHNEILSKDMDLSNLKKENEVLKQNLETLQTESKTNANVKLENLQSQNKKLIEKVEALTQKSNTQESDLLKIEIYKMEIQDLKQNEAFLQNELATLERVNSAANTNLEHARKMNEELTRANAELIEKLSREKTQFETQISQLREDAKKGLLSLEPKIKEKLQKEYHEKEEDLKQEFTKKIEELSTSSNNVKELQLKILQKDDDIKKMHDELATIKSELTKRVDDYNNLEKNHLELIEDTTKLRNAIANFEKDKQILDTYEEKTTRLESHINTLQQEARTLEDVMRQKEEEIVSLSKENADLQQELRKTSEKSRILEEKTEAIDLDSTENKLLELKLQKLEEEQTNLLSEFESERRMFNDMLDNNNELQEKQLNIEILKETLKKCHEEIDRLKKLLEEQQIENVEIHKAKLQDEKHLKKLEERIRIFEEKDEAINLDKNECGLLELKLQKLEAENKKLLDSFEQERVSFAKDLEAIKNDLTPVVEKGMESMQFNVDNNLKHKLNEIKRLSEAREEESVILAKENLESQKKIDSLSGKLRLLEEKLETAQMESTESQLLKLKVQNLGEEREKMFREYEVEKKMYEGLLENHKEIIEKNNVISLLEDDLTTHKVKVAQLQSQLSEEEKEKIHLAEEKLILEKEIAKLQEKIRIFEEKEESWSINTTECGLLEFKLQKLEIENQDLIKSFEVERANFEKQYKEISRDSHKVSEMQEEICNLKVLLDKGKVEIAELQLTIKHHEDRYQEAEAEYSAKTTELKAKLKITNEELRKLRESSSEMNKSHIDKLNSITSENEKLRKEIEEKDETVSELSKNLQSLSQVIQKQTLEFNSLLERTQQLETVLEKMRSDSTEAIKKEKEHQNELTLKIQELQKEQDQKTEEFVNLNKKVTELEILYSEEKKNYQSKMQETESLQKKLAELQALEDSYKTMGEEQEVVLAELARLKSIENEKNNLETKLKTLEQDSKQCSMQLKVGEQENRILQEEKDVLLGEIEDLRSRIVELGKEHHNLKSELSQKGTSDLKSRQLQSENEALALENEKNKQEIDELNIRIQQVSADNRHHTERNQSLMDETERLKIQLELLENEKSQFDIAKDKLNEEKAALSNSFEEVKQKLDQVEKHNESLTRDHNTASNNGIEIAQIQKDFFDIKTKCDELFIENKNLKAEYGKLEEKCNNFGKIKSNLEGQITELESHYNEILHEKQLLQDEIEELKTSPVNFQSDMTRLDKLATLQKEKSLPPENGDRHLREIEILRDKLTKYKSLDLTNKSSIEFYENELQKTKNANDKLSRKLDETLVTLNHCAELSTSTEVEYLRNVLYNYMLGKESMVLARVIAAVCKFDAQQTETILQKEQQKQTLLGQLGLM